MAHRAAATRQTTPRPGAAICPPAANRIAATRAATSRRSAGLPLVPGVARPAADLLVTGPDAATTTAPSRLRVTTCRVLRRAQDRTLPVLRAPFGAGSLALVSPGCADQGAGRSIVPVRTVNDDRSTRVLS